jgi:hypothetical protein
MPGACRNITIIAMERQHEADFSIPCGKREAMGEALAI